MRPLARRAAARRRGGFSLVEVVVSVGVLALLLGAVTQTGLTGQKAFDSMSERTVLASRARRTSDRVAAQLVTAGPSVVFPAALAPFGSATLDYQRAEGLNGAGIAWGLPLRLSFEYEAGEVDDGLDNDGDGLVDEGVVVFTRNVGAASALRVLWCRGVAEYLEGELPNGVDDNGNGLVDERGFCLERDGETVTVRLSVMAAGPQSTLLSTTETSVRMRNP